MLRLGGLSDFSELFRVKIRSRYYFNRELKNRYLIRINDGNTSSFPFILNGAILEANIFFLWKLRRPRVMAIAYPIATEAKEGVDKFLGDWRT